MSKLTLRAISIAIIVIVVAALAYVAFTSLTSYSKPKDPRITEWSASTELVSDERRRCGHKCRKYGRVKRWRYRAGAGQPFRMTLDAAIEDAEARRGDKCRRVSITSHGGNAVFTSIVTAGLSGTWCWNHGKIRKHRMNTWHDEAGWALWQYKGAEVFAKVCKEGKRLRCGRVYRRVGYTFRRGIGSFSQSASTWAAYSLRPGGRYSWDKK